MQQHHLSFRRSKALAEAGLEPPPPYFGQMWYVVLPHGLVEGALVGSVFWHMVADKGFPMYYAATARDIVPDFNARFAGRLVLSYQRSRNRWVAQEMRVLTSQKGRARGKHKRMDEAAAKAWLSAYNAQITSLKNDLPKIRFRSVRSSEQPQCSRPRNHPQGIG